MHESSLREHFTWQPHPTSDERAKGTTAAELAMMHGVSKAYIYMIKE